MSPLDLVWGKLLDSGGAPADLQEQSFPLHPGKADDLWIFAAWEMGQCKAEESMHSPLKHHPHTPRGAFQCSGNVWCLGEMPRHRSSFAKIVGMWGGKEESYLL